MNDKQLGLFKGISVLLLLVAVGAVFVAMRSSRIASHILLPPSTYSDLGQYGYEYLTVGGTFVGMTGGGVGNPLNTNEFTCDNEVKECRLIQAQLTDEGFLSSYSEVFPIETWTSDVIVFSTAPESGQCVVWTYRIDRRKQELTGVREPISGYNYDKCFGIGVDRFTVKLVDGFKALNN